MEVESRIQRGGNRMSEIKHHGVKGMKWGVRRYQNSDGSRKPAGKKRERKGGSLKTKYVNAMDKANAKSAAGTAKRRAAIKAAPKKALSGYKNAMEKADAKSAAGTAKRKAAVKAAPKKYMEAVKKHESRPKGGLTDKLPNAAVGVVAGLAFNSVMAGPAAMAGRSMFGSQTGALAGVLASNAASVDLGMKVYKRMNERSR